MRRRHKMVVSLVLASLLPLALWLAFSGRTAQPRLSVGYALTRGYYREPPARVEDIAVAWITNTGPSSILWGSAYMEFENSTGQLVESASPSWNRQAISAHLLPGAPVRLTCDFNGDRRRMRFCFVYQRSSDPLLGAISKITRLLPLRLLPRRTCDWMQRNGLVDGTMFGLYMGPWLANPQGGTNGKQPFSSEINRTSAAAASRCSP